MLVQGSGVLPPAPKQQMGQQLRNLAALTKNLSSVLGTHKITAHSLKSSSRECKHLLHPQGTRHTCAVHTQMQAKLSYTKDKNK